MRNRAFFVFTACSESIVFEGIAFEILNLLQALRCNTQFKKVCVLQRRACNKFKRNYLANYNDSEHAVKTKNATFFMIFPNISFFHMVVTYWTGPLRLGLRLGISLGIRLGIRLGLRLGIELRLRLEIR